MIGIIIFIISIVITAFICKIINQNSIGTTYAYVRRFFLVWLIVIAILCMICGKIGII